VAKESEINCSCSYSFFFFFFFSLAPAAGKPAAGAAAAGGAAGGKAAGGKAGGKGGKGGKDKAGGAKTGGPAAPTLPAISTTTDNIIRGVNVLKGKSDPALLPDSEYPPWLWQFVMEKDQKGEALQQSSDLKLREIEEARVKAVGAEVDLKAMLDTRKMLRKDQKKAIKNNNFLKAKK